MDHNQHQSHNNQLQYDSSMEELSLEAKLLLASTKRQEPQGEEHTNLPSPSCILNYSTNTTSNPPNQKSQSANSASSNRNLSAQKYGPGTGVGKRSNSGSPRESSTTTSQSSESSYSEDEDQDTKSKGSRSKPADRQRASSAAPSQKCISKVQQAGHYGHGQPIARTKGLSSNISTDSGNSAYNTLIIHQNNSSLLADTWIPASHEFTSVSMGANASNNNNGHSHSNSMGVLPNYAMAVAPQPLPRNMAHYDPTGTGRVQPYSNPYENLNLFGALGGGVGRSSEISEIPRDYLNQLTVLKHLAKEVHQQDPVSGTGSGSSLLRSSSFSKSQPDLTQAGPSRVQQDPNHGGASTTGSKPQPQEPRRTRSKQAGGNKEKSPTTSNVTHQDVMPSVQILELLMRENAVLNAELVKARLKIQTIHKLEAELDRLQAQHSELFESAERRESLERTARAKLSTELNRVKKVNRELMSSSGSIQNLSSSGSGASASGEVEGLRKELANKDILITQLLSQNKELQSIKERQEIELTAQRATLSEQRTHIDILDSALTNAQASVLRLEEEVRKKQEIVDKSGQLQRAFSNLQITNDKREENERAARSQLEEEITDLKLRLASMNANGTSRPTPTRSYQSPPPYGASHSHQSPQTSRFDLNENAQQQMNYLQEKLKVSEDQIHHLNSQVSRWENVFDYQQQRKQSTGSTTITTPNTPNSRGGTPHFFPSSSEKLGSGGSDSHSTELEWKIKDLETRLVERDAMIRALRGPAGGPAMVNYRESPSYSQASTASYASPASHHHRQASASTGSASALYSQTVNDELPNYANIRMRLGGSGSSLVNTSNNSKKNSNESLQMQGTATGSSGSLASGTNSKTIEEQLKDLDSQLLTKGSIGGGAGSGLPVGTLKIQSGLCCIPGFPNSALTKGKGNLASLNAQAAMLASRKSSYYLPPKPIPKPPPSTYQTQNHGSSSSGRAGSGPPFINQSSQMQQANSSTVITPLSNSVDSGLSDSNSKSGAETHAPKDVPGSHVFTPASISSLPKGLPPRPDSGGPSTRSLERNRPLPNELVGKYTVITNRCRSLDRRELKKTAEEKQAQETPVKKPEKEFKGNLKSKAAFFGQLLSRRSPSPSRDKSDKEKEPSTPKSSRRFTFGKSSSEKTSAAPPAPSSEDVETIILEKQGRQSQSQRSNRISSKWTSTQALEVVEEAQSGTESTATSPWVQRKSKEESQEQQQPSQLLSSNENEESSVPTDKKWGRIVKTPFGLRYTFGSPRVASSVPLEK